jgi:hypothetical protein
MTGNSLFDAYDAVDCDIAYINRSSLILTVNEQHLSLAYLPNHCSYHTKSVYKATFTVKYLFTMSNQASQSTTPNFDITLLKDINNPTWTDTQKGEAKRLMDNIRSKHSHRYLLPTLCSMTLSSS